MEDHHQINSPVVQAVLVAVAALALARKIRGSTRIGRVWLSLERRSMATISLVLNNTKLFGIRLLLRHRRPCLMWTDPALVRP